jgi:hypothetical protein
MVVLLLLLLLPAGRECGFQLSGDFDCLSRTDLEWR